MLAPIYAMRREHRLLFVQVHFRAVTPLHALTYVEHADGHVLDVWTGRYRSIRKIWQTAIDRIARNDWSPNMAVNVSARDRAAAINVLMLMINPEIEKWIDGEGKSPTAYAGRIAYAIAEARADGYRTACHDLARGQNPRTPSDPPAGAQELADNEPDRNPMGITKL